jgi:hypothetical protein
MTHLYAVDGRPLFVYNDGIDVTAEDNGDGGLVFPLSRFAQIDKPAANTWDT